MSTNQAEAPGPQAHDDESGPPGALDRLIHETVECLTAIRNYAAGARRALAGGAPEQADPALVKIDAQVYRAHDLLGKARQINNGDRPSGQARPPPV
ncbi:MAG TPA: hypothetical protein VFN42_07410 [Acetobacteraceae bacterium]|nr:hypothetical protein [Acetobacteraceae bacterium]